MRSTRLALYDSYKSARGSLQPLFSAFRSPSHVQRETRRFVLTRSRHLEGLSRAQQRSWVRANLSLVLQESRRQKNYTVADAALRVALTEKDWIETIDPAWVKDAAASCRSVEELRALQALLSAHPSELAGLGGAGGKDGDGANLLAILVGGSGPVGGGHERAAQLGDSDAQEALARLDDDADGASLPEGDSRSALVGQLSPEERVAFALAKPAVEAAAAGAEEGTRDSMQRTMAAMRRLEERREGAVVTPNQSFARYFLRQGIVKTERELMALFQAMRARPEEIGFRVHLSHPHGASVRQLLEGREGIGRVSWMPPAAGAYTLDCTNAAAMHANRSLLRALAKERVLSFQSKSSMLPVHLLDPQPGERVLDLCASPGSKSTLILDLMATTPSASPGCVCANEANHDRARELVGRLQNYGVEAMVTRARGESFGFNDDEGDGGGGGHLSQRHLAAAGAAPVENYFDKVLVDAPCSGEGRMGRDVMAWRLWHPGQGLAFFPRQVALLQRALEVCRPGGTVVYATCTLNPIENEAVVAAVLRANAGVVELATPPPLRDVATPAAVMGGGEREALAFSAAGSRQESRPMILDRGLANWAVPSGSGGFYSSAREALAQDGASSRLPTTVFAPGEGEVDATGLGEQLHRCCRRVLPHHNGAGAEGFFVAVLRKRKATSTTAAAAGQLLQPPSPRGREHSAPPPSSSSLLHARGLSRLPASHAVVQQLLHPFCAFSAVVADPVALILNKNNCLGSGVQKLLAETGWVPLWREEEGLRFVSASVHGLTKVLTTSSGGGGGSAIGAATAPHLATTADSRRVRRTNSPTRLLDAGVLAFDGAGRLTERGASLLRPYASSRVWALPPLYVQLLLANSQLDVSEDGEDGGAAADPVAAARRQASNGLVSGTRAAAASPGAWAGRIVSDVARLGPGNAIVVVVHTGEAPAGSTGSPPDQWARFAGSWAIPVHAEVSKPNGRDSHSVVRLRLLLSREARHRNTAMIGRLQGQMLRGTTEKGVREYLRDSEDYNVSHVMDTKELVGAPPSPAARQQRLFGNPRETSDGSAKARKAKGEEEEDDGSIFEF